jgi:hypothetical protein
MRRTNTIVCIISLLLIVMNVFIHFVLKEWRESEPMLVTSNDAQSGIAPAALFAITWLLNSIATGTLFLITVVQGIISKKIFNIYTLLVMGLIIFTFFVPPFLN